MEKYVAWAFLPTMSKVKDQYQSQVIVRGQECPRYKIQSDSKAIYVPK